MSSAMADTTAEQEALREIAQAIHRRLRSILPASQGEPRGV